MNFQNPLFKIFRRKKKIPKDVIQPLTIGGMLKQERYKKLRQMGLKADEIAALCWLHEKGEYPGELLFSGTKRQILSTKYRRLRIAAVKEVNKKFRQMRKAMIETLKKTKEKMESEGVDFKSANQETKQLQEELKEKYGKNRIKKTS
jgi:hypothetical protein